MSEQEQDRVVMDLAMGQAGWDTRPLQILYEIRERVGSLCDEGKGLDTGTDGTSADLWIWVGGREYLVNLRPSNATLKEEGKPLPVIPASWEPIETAPVLSLAEVQAAGKLWTYTFPCMLQGQRGEVWMGYAKYVQRSSTAKVKNFDIRWYGEGRGWIPNPKYWMPIPAPKQEPA